LHPLNFSKYAFDPAIFPDLFIFVVDCTPRKTNLIQRQFKGEILSLHLSLAFLIRATDGFARANGGLSFGQQGGKTAEGLFAWGASGGNERHNSSL